MLPTLNSFVKQCGNRLISRYSASRCSSVRFSTNITELVRATILFINATSIRKRAEILRPQL